MTKLHLAVRGCAQMAPSPSRRGQQQRLLKEVLATSSQQVNDQDPEGRTPLMYACQIKEGGAEIVELLCQHGADVCATDTTGTTAFMLAAAHGQWKGGEGTHYTGRFP